MTERMVIVTRSMHKHFVANESKKPVNGLREAACNQNIVGYVPAEIPKHWRDNKTTWRVINAPMCKRCKRRYRGTA